VKLGGLFALLVVVLLLDAIFLKAHELFEGEENGALFLFRHVGSRMFPGYYGVRDAGVSGGGREAHLDQLRS
jgi:hypothetical protein